MTSSLFTLIAAQNPAAGFESGMDGFRPVAVALAFVVTVAVVWVVSLVLSRLRQGNSFSGSKVVGPDDGPLGPWASALAAQLPESKKDSSEFQKLLRAAGFYQPYAAKTVYALRFLLFVLPLVVAGTCAIIAPRESTFGILFSGGIAAIGLSVVPRFYVLWRRKRRQASICRALPDALDMMGMCVDGGMPLSPALAYVSRQLPHSPALSQELAILKRQAEVSSLKSALIDFADRIQVSETRQLASLLTRSDRLGKQMAGSLREHADRLRVSRRQAATRRANKTPVKLVFPIMFCFAPAALILLVSPAIIELKEFIAPTTGQSVLSENGTLNTRSLINTIGNVDQTFEVPERSGS